MKSLKIYFKYTLNSFQMMITNRIVLIMIILGKLLRIVLFLIFLNFLLDGTKGIAQFNKDQVIFFYLTFNLIDTTSQMLFREIYRFRQLVIDGNLDFILLKPINPLIRVLLGGTDFFDLLTLIIISAFLAWFGSHYITANITAWILYLGLVANSLLIAASFSIFVLGLGVLTTSVEHFVWVYRDLTSLLRIPVDLYSQPLRFLITFVVPLGIMITFPAKALMGILSIQFVLFSFVFGVLSLLLSLRFWSFTLKHYQSASS